MALGAVVAEGRGSRVRVELNWAVVIARVRSQLAISMGAACSSGVEAPSHVLQALGLPSDVVEGALLYWYR